MGKGSGAGRQYLRFVHLDEFTSDWEHLGLDDDDLRALELTICAAPDAAPVVPGSGGVRKMRFAPPSMRSGKRGALRVLYAVFPKYVVCLLAGAYRKNEREDISAEERRALRKVIKEADVALSRERGV